MECKWSKGFRVQGSTGSTEKVAAFAAYLYEAMPEGRTFASLSTLAEKFFKNQKTVQYSEKFFHFWKFVHYTEQFDPSIYFSSNDCMRRKSLSFT